MARTPTTSADQSAPNVALDDLNREAAEAGAAATTAEARNKAAGRPARDKAAPKSDDAA
jgi:hypothetical protein